MTPGGGILGQVGSILGLSLEDLGPTWVQLGVILGHVGAILGLYWDDLGPTWVHFGA